MASASSILSSFALLATLLSMFPEALPQRVGDNFQQYLIKPREYKRQAKTLCGKMLWDALDLVCQGRFNSPAKRSKLDNNERWTEMILQRMRSAEPDESYFEYSSDFLAPKNAFAVLGSPEKPAEDIGLLYKRGSKAQGVVDECCKKACTIQEMRTYCLPK